MLDPALGGKLGSRLEDRRRGGRACREGNEPGRRDGERTAGHGPAGSRQQSSPPTRSSLRRASQPGCRSRRRQGPASERGALLRCPVRAGERIVMERNRFYKGSRPHHVDRIVATLNATEGAIVDEIATGAIDWGYRRTTCGRHGQRSSVAATASTRRGSSSTRLRSPGCSSSTRADRSSRTT